MTSQPVLHEIAELTDPAARAMMSRFVESEITMLEARVSQLKEVQEALREARN
jgi:hypothetical protein